MNAKHVREFWNEWQISKFNTEELFSSLGKIIFGDSYRGANFVEKIEQLWQEIEARPGSTIKPIPVYGKNKITSYNTIVTNGLGALVDQLIGAGSLSVLEIQLGTDGYDEEESDNNGVKSPVGDVKDYTASGGRSKESDGKTAKFTMTFDQSSDNISADTTIREAAQRLSDSSTYYSRIAFPGVKIGTGESILAQINTLNRNGV